MIITGRRIKMDFDVCKTNVENYIDNMPEDIKSFYDQILKDINNLMNDEEVDSDIENMKSIIRGLVDDCFSGGISFERLNFYESITFLIYNWNNNTVKDADIFTYCFVIKKFISILIPIKEGRDLIKHATELISVSSRWFPASNEISIKYLDALFEKHEASEKETSLEQNINEKCCG